MTTIPTDQAEKTFLASDTHFGHINILRYCHRPFGNIVEMNNALIRNWNEVVSPDATVYFLGDLCYGRYCGYPFQWLFKLNGQMVFIRGSHDHDMPKCLTRPYEILSIDGEKLYLVHNYQDVPKDWDGWIIHGHNHHQRPFINHYRRRVNISVERTGYKPVSLAQIVELIKNGEGK